MEAIEFRVCSRTPQGLNFGIAIHTRTRTDMRNTRSRNCANFTGMSTNFDNFFERNMNRRKECANCAHDLGWRFDVSVIPPCGGNPSYEDG